MVSSAPAVYLQNHGMSASRVRGGVGWGGDKCGVLVILGRKGERGGKREMGWGRGGGREVCRRGWDGFLCGFQ